MKTTEESTRRLIGDLFEDQNLAVLATQDQGQPYTSLVGFWAAPDLKHLYFATPRTTRKFMYLERDPRVSMLVNNSSNQASDFHGALAVTIIGDAKEAADDLQGCVVPQYLRKHPHLKDFIRADSTAFVAVAVRKYLLVHHFQNVWELDLQS